MSSARFSRITSGPYAGRYTVHRAGDRRISGRHSKTGRRWSRLPYYGHVWRAGGRWRAERPGGGSAGTFPTRAAAGARLLELVRVGS